jgi:hypothetical protein
MGFKSTLRQHREDELKAETEPALIEARARAQRALNLASQKGEIESIVKPIFKTYSEEALDEGYDSREFCTEEESRCTWFFSFDLLPINSLETPISVKCGPSVNALVRLHDDGDVKLEWLVPPYLDERFSYEEKNRKFRSSDVNAQLIEGWLEEFVSKMMKLKP